MNDKLTIVEYTDALADTFYRINAEWIESMFAMEETDRRILLHPREAILDGGGVICFVRDPELGIVGTCALMKTADGAFELTKMGVLESARGKKAGEFLLRHVLERARAMKIDRLFLLTNTKCASAIHLYEKVGFEHDEVTLRDRGGSYARCDVGMIDPPSKLG